RRATPLVRKARLKLAQRSRPSHPMSPPPDADRRRTAPSYYILTNLGQRDEPQQLYEVKTINCSNRTECGEECRVARDCRSCASAKELRLARVVLDPRDMPSLG